MANLQILSLTENSYRLKNARSFIDSLSNDEYNLYCFAGYATSFSSINTSITTSVQVPTPDIKTSFNDVWRNMLFGKQVQQADCNLVISYNAWIANTVYTQYDDTDPNLSQKQYFVHVNEVSYTHCYKCLYNNQNSYSTQMPSITDINGEDNIFTTSDNYQWKYMYSVDQSTVSKFGTSTTIPVIANAQVSEYAEPGAIDVITVDNPGLGYSNYTNGTFSVSDTRLDGNNLIYSINAAKQPSSVNTFYNGCILLITSGTGAGQYSNIVDYHVNTTQHYVILENSFFTVPMNGSEYIISPGISIVGDGTETNQAFAYAQVNAAAGNSISSVVMLNVGAEYKTAKTSINHSNVVPVTTEAVVRAIQSPPGGHGYDIANELGCNTVCISVTFANTEGNTIPSTGSYRQIGLLENPVFSLATLEVSNQVGEYLIGEKIATFTKLKINQTASVNVTSSLITSVDGDFLNQLSINTNVILSQNGVNQISQVNNIINSSCFSISTNGYFNASNTTIYIADLGSFGYGSGSSVGLINLANINGSIVTGQNIVGLDSSTIATVNSVSRSNIEKGFNTFVQMYGYDGYQISGNFVESEQIYQLSQSEYGYYDSQQTLNGTLRYYISNQLGIFDYSANIVGLTSEAVAHIDAVWPPELVYGTGEIIYIENFDQVQRGNNYSEQVKMFFNF